MTANAINGSLVLLQVRTASGPDVYTTVGGTRGLKIKRDRKALSTSSKDDTDDTFAGARRTSTAHVDGLVVTGDVARAALIAAHNGTGAARIRRTALGTEPMAQADAIITNIEEDFPDDAESTWSVDFQITGPWT